jgi:hypothetical protein
MKPLNSVLLFFAIITIACVLSAVAWYYPKFAFVIACAFFVGIGLSAWYFIVGSYDQEEDRELD